MDFLRIDFPEVVHQLRLQSIVPALLEKPFKEFLRMGPGLVAFAAANVIRNFVPVFTVQLQGFDERGVLLFSPSASVLRVGASHGLMRGMQAWRKKTLAL